MEKRKCAEYGLSKSGNKRCVRFVTVSENPVENSGEIIEAKATDGASLGYFDVAEVSDALGSLKGIASVEKILPPLIGGSVAILGTLLIRKFVADKTSSLVRFAPAIGAGAGVLASIPLYWVYGQEGVMSGALTSVMAGGAILAFQELKDMPVFNGLGLVSMQRKRLGAIAQGGGARIPQTANVPGRISSAMDVAAFGGKPTY